MSGVIGNNAYQDSWYTKDGKYIYAWKGEHARVAIGFIGIKLSIKNYSKRSLGWANLFINICFSFKLEYFWKERGGNKMKKLTFFIIFLVIGSIAGGVFFFSQNNKFSVVLESPVENLKAEIIKEEINSSALEEEASVEKIEKSLPSTFKLEVPFVPQAPFAVWDDDHNEACEEAAILTVDTYLKKKAITPELADKEILAMINYQKENWQGVWLTAEDIAKLAEEFYDYKNTEINTIFQSMILKKLWQPVIYQQLEECFGPLEEGKNPYYRS